MSFLKSLNTAPLEKPEDRAGGSFEALPTDIYKAVVDYAYLDKYGSGSHFVAMGFTSEDGRKYFDRLLLTNKQGLNYYEREGKKYALPGFQVFSDLVNMITGKGIDELSDPEEKVIKQKRNGEEQQVAVEMLTDLLGGTVNLAIVRKITTKMEKDADGQYTIPTTEERTENSIEKVMHEPSMLTMVEAERGLEKGEFYLEWLKNNKGKDRDARYKGNMPKAGAPARAVKPLGAAPTAGSAAAAPKKNLFAK